MFERLPAELARTLAVVVDEGSLDAAAAALHVTPSAVSQRLKSLEEHVGQVLLVRSKPVRPTDAAHAVLRYARQVALLEREAIAAVSGTHAERATLALAVNADSLATWFLAPLARVASRHPVTFDLHRDDQDFTAGLLESGTVMGAVTSRKQPVAGCRVRTLGTLRYVAVAAPAFIERHFAGGATCAALADAPVIDFDRRDDIQTLWLRAQGADAAAAPRHRVPASHDFAEAVALGLGWALLPEVQARSRLDAGSLVALGGAPVDVPLYWQQWNLRSDLLDAVADEVVAEARRVLRA